jgi:hypothetical protein
MQPFSRYIVSTSAVTCVRYPGYPVTLQDLIRAGDSVQKEELLHLHMLMFHIRMYFEGIAHDEISTERYDSLAISPLHLHKDKKAHKDAVLTLGDEIVSHILGQKLSVVNISHETASLALVAAQH